MAKAPDIVKMAKDISKLTKVPLPKVANVMQKNGLDAAGLKKSYDECAALGAEQMKKDLKTIFPF